MLMRHKLLRSAGTFAILCAVVSWASAQPPADSGGREPRPAAGRPPEIREEKPEVFHLRDEKGNLVLVPTFSFEEWERLMKLDIGRGPAQPPAYTFLGEGQLTALVAGEQVQLEARFRIRLSEVSRASPTPSTAADEESWVRIPLRFGNAALTEPPKGKEGDSLSVHFDEAAGGYVVWLRGKGGSEHEVVLRLVRPLQKSGAEKRFSIQTPPVPTRLTLEIPAPRATTEALNATTSVMKTEHPTPATTLVTAVGASGDFQMAWREADVADSKAPAVLEAMGWVTVRVEGQQRVRSEVRLRVRSLGPAINEFLVRLPAGMRLAAESGSVPGTELEISAVDGVADPASEGRVAIRVRLARETAGPVEVQLPIELAPSSGSSPQNANGIEVANFEVVGAVRQSGYIDLVVEGDLAVRWREGNKVNRVDEVPDVPIPDGSVARFEYLAQPCALHLDIAPKRVRAMVEPIYLVDAQPDRLDLTAIYRYSVGGGKVDRLRFDFAGWTVQRVSPSNLPVPDLALQPLSPFVVPLAFEAQGNFEVQIHATRPLEGSLRFDFSLPRPLDATLTPATLALISAENVEITPRNEELRGLVPESLPPPVNLPPRQQPPLFFREQGPAALDGRQAGAASQFSGELRIRERMVSLATDVTLAVSEQGVQVVETFTFQIAYVPLRSVTFSGPRVLWESGTLRISSGGTALPFRPVDDRSQTPPADDVGQQAAPRTSAVSGHTLMRVDLLENRLGTCAISLEYNLPLSWSGDQKAAESTIPFLLPVPEEDVNVSPAMLHVVRPENLQVNVRGSDWAEVPAAVSRAGQLDFEAGVALAPDETVLGIRRVASALGSATVVHRLWWQTWLTASERRDRLAWRLTTSERELRVLLPENASLANVEVACNHQPCSMTVGRDGETVIRLPEMKRDAPRMLEMYCWMPRETGKGVNAVFEMPRIAGVERVERLYWELALPPNEHLLLGPAAWVPEFHWQWQGGLLNRIPNETQLGLEVWSGASRQEPLPAVLNRYLFSTMGQVERTRVMTATRPVLAMTIVGPLLLAGLIGLLYLDWMRPLTLGVLGTVAAAISFVYPEPAVLVAQLAVIAFVLLLVARLLQVQLPQRAPVLSPRAGSTMIRTEAPLSDLLGPATSAGSHVTTATVPVPVPLSAESKP